MIDRLFGLGIVGSVVAGILLLAPLGGWAVDLALDTAVPLVLAFFLGLLAVTWSLRRLR